MSKINDEEQKRLIILLQSQVRCSKLFINLLAIKSTPSRSR